MYFAPAFALVGLLLGYTAAFDTIPVSLYIDYDCNTPSTTATGQNFSVEACTPTVGLLAFKHQLTPCVHGGNVKSWTFGDSSCSSNSLFPSYESDCISRDSYFGAIGSVLLTCSQGGGYPHGLPVVTTVNVGPAVGGGTSNTTAVGSSGDSSSDSSSSSPSGSSSNGGSDGSSSGLSTAAKAGIAVAAVIVGILGLAGGVTCCAIHFH